MAEIDTGKLTPEQRKEAQTSGNDPMGDAKGIAKGLPEPYRSIILLLITGVGMFGGGAAGQSVFGISEEKLNQKFVEQDRAIEAKFEVLKAQDQGKQLLVQNNIDDIRELQGLVRELEKRLAKAESGK